MMVLFVRGTSFQVKMEEGGVIGAETGRGIRWKKRQGRGSMMGYRRSTLGICLQDATIYIEKIRVWVMFCWFLFFSKEGLSV